VIFRNRDEFSECYIVQLSSRVSVFPIDVRDNIRSWELSGEIAKLEVRLSVENVVEKVAELFSRFVLSVRVEDSSKHGESAVSDTQDGVLNTNG